MGDHTETVQIDYDPGTISYGDLLAEFWTSHRPTGPAPGYPQYASIIFYADDEQRQAAEASVEIVESHMGPVHTRVEPLETFYLAEKYHQHYYAKRGVAGLCAIGAKGAAR